MAEYSFNGGELAHLLNTYAAIASYKTLLNSPFDEIRTAGAEFISPRLDDFKVDFPEALINTLAIDINVLKTKCLEILAKK